uniref:E3 ubiquitin-protein ligase RMA n=1 Tax=Kalanchoe fedtschenkoi TaxID=63787 RepID=A0A7N0V0Q1_KALFE
MADETPNSMNLDLNLGPGLMPAPEEDTINLDDWIDEPADRIREAVRRTNRQRWRWRHFENPLESQNLSMDFSQFLTSVSNQGGLHLGEGSVAAGERASEVEKLCENKAIEVDDETLGSKEEDEKGSGDDGSFYDCNICFELAKDPVITCCGHLYCWPCIYRWLHIHSDTKECPVCKGEVTTKNVTPVYGRGHNNRVPEEDLTLRIPPRPSAKRVESVQRNSFTIPMEEMIRRLGSRFDLTRDFSATQDPENIANPPDRNPAYLLNRLMTTRALRTDQIVAPPENVLDFTQSRAASPDAVGNSGVHARLLRRPAAHRSINTASPFPSSMSTSERVIEAYIRSHPIIVRRPEQSPPVDDRDSFSSIAAVMHSGSQIMDTAVEIDSVVSLSTSSSRRRNETSRASDVDSGDSRPPRRRRLN